MTRLPLAAVLLLAACGPIVQVGGNAPRPAALYTLTPAAAAAPARTGAISTGAVSLETAVTVETPTMPGALRTVRIPVTISETAIQYLVAAQWAEQPNRLFQRLLAETIATGGTAIVDPRSSGFAAGQRLTGELTAFGVDMREGRPVAHVRYDATFQTPSGLRQRRFEAREVLAATDGPAAAAGLNRAANKVATEVAQWIRSG